MGWREILFGERDAVPAPATLIGFSGPGVMPYSVDSYSALALSAVWRSVDILCNGVAQLDWRERRGNLDLPPSRLVLRPSVLITRRDWTSRVVESLALYDTAYLLKVGGEDSEGVPMGLWPLDPNIVGPATTQTPLFYPPTAYVVAGVIVPADGIVVIRRSMHASIPDNMAGIIRIARATMSAAISAENYASRYWQSGGSTNTVLETDQRLTPQQKNDLSDAWRVRKSQGPDYAPVMDGGTKARSTGADPTAESAVEARRELVADAGRYFGIPTALLNAPAGDSETYRSNDMANADLLRYTLVNYIQGIQDAITDQLPGGRCMEMDTYPLIRASQLLEAQAIDLLTGHKAVLSVEEARDILALPPIEDPTDLLTGQVDAPDLMPESAPMPMEMPA